MHDPYIFPDEMSRKTIVNMNSGQTDLSYFDASSREYSPGIVI